MASLNDIKIQISMLTKALSVKGFALPLILGKRESGALMEVYGEYASLAEMTTAGFATTDDEYKMAAKMFAQSPCPDKVAVYCRDQADEIDDALAALITAHNDWYALLITERVAASLALAGDFALANEKLFFGCASAIAALTGRNNNREAYLIHNLAAEFPEAAWVGLCLPQTIGSITWKWKSPTGVSESNFSTTELGQIRDGHGQTFSKRSGIVYSDEGITTGGEYIDNMMSRDYVKTRLEEALFNLQIKNGKIPFDNSGFKIIEATMREVFNTCGQNGIIAKVETEDDQKKSDEGKYMYTITIPERADIPATDRAARKIPGIKFAFTVAGAVHGMEIAGVIEV